MNEDDLLARIRDHVRSERVDDAALESVARGETGAPGVDELERRAEQDADVAAMLAGSRPLGGAAEARIAAQLMTKATPASTAPAPAPAPSKARPTVVPFARRLALLAGPLALAAAVLVLVLGRGTGERGSVDLPDYAVSASSDETMRGPASPAPSARLRLRQGDAPFELLVRPATSPGSKVVAYVFAIGEGEPNPVDARVEIAPEGAIRIRGRSRALAGAREVRVVVGVANESIGRFEDALSRAREGKSDASVRVLVVPISRE